MKSTASNSLPPAVGPGQTPAYRFTGLYRQRPDELGPARYFAGIEYGDDGQGFIGVLEALGTSPAKALEHAEFFQNKLNTSAAHEARIAALARDLSDAEIELRLCSELLGDYARGAVNDHAETFRRIGVASTVIANVRAALASAKSP